MTEKNTLTYKINLDVEEFNKLNNILIESNKLDFELLTLYDSINELNIMFAYLGKNNELNEITNYVDSKRPEIHKNSKYRKCYGIERNKTNCNSLIHENELYCIKHKYLSKYNITIFSDIYNSTNQWKNCKKCTKWTKEDHLMCDKCYIKFVKHYKIINIDNTKKYELRQKVENILNTVNIKKCNGITRNFEQCHKNIVVGKYCNVHSYMNNYIDNQLYKITLCSGCKMFKYIENNLNCIDCKNRIKETNKIIIDPKNEDMNEPIKYTNFDDVKIVYFNTILDSTNMFTVIENSNIYCNVYKYTNKNKKCEKKAIKGSEYCMSHKYMESYTKEQLNNIDICSGCKKPKYLDKIKRCDFCYSRNIRNSKRKILCRYENCKRGKLEENDYCGKHQLYLYKLIADASGVKVCKNYIRGCRTLVDEENKRCIKCMNTISIRLRDVKRCAELRNIPFKLNNTEIIELINKHCTYCGISPEVPNQHGIDRINSKLDYTIDNVTTACRLCNKIKFTFEVNDFINYCINISKYYPCKEKSTVKNLRDYNKWLDINSKRKLSGKNMEINITENDFNEILGYKCYYCANNNSDKIGIDRIDSTKGYIDGNMVSCCSRCNLMKNTSDLTDFIDKVNKIVNHNIKQKL
jgi:hypothetical protein